MLYFIKMWRIFVSSLNNFGRSDDDMILGKTYYVFLLDAWYIGMWFHAQVTQKNERDFAP